jgi:hypothetical protein
VGIELLTERHAAQVAGMLGCWDRMLIFGTLPGVCFAGGMTSFSVREEDSHLRLPEVRRAVPEPDSGERRTDGGGRWHPDRVHPQAKLPEGRSGEADPGETRGAGGVGVHVLGDGAVPKPGISEDAKYIAEETSEAMHRAATQNRHGASEL